MLSKKQRRRLAKKNRYILKKAWDLWNKTNEKAHQEFKESNSWPDMEENAGNRDGLDPSTLDDHCKTHTANKCYKCFECGNCFWQSSAFLTHRRTHTREKPFKCLECGKSFWRSSAFLIHRRTHMEKPFKCLECGKRFIQKSGLGSHQRMHIRKKPFECLQCGNRFCHKKGLSKHQLIHKEENPLKCFECGQSFTHKDTLRAHEKVHTQEIPYKCLECGRTFSQKASLSQHRKSHKGTSSEQEKFESTKQPSPTEDLGQPGALWASSSLSVVPNKPFNHSGKKPYKCQECGKSFRQKSYLNAHQRIHSGEKPYICLECGKRFSQDCSLRYHQKLHTGEKPYICLECGMRFYQSSALISHRRTHTGEKLYQCFQCGQGFNLRQAFTSHQKLHTEGFPYKCLVCGRTFNRKASLSQHWKSHKGTSSEQVKSESPKQPSPTEDLGQSGALWTSSASSVVPNKPFNPTPSPAVIPDSLPITQGSAEHHSQCICWDTWSDGGTTHLTPRKPFRPGYTHEKGLAQEQGSIDEATEEADSAATAEPGAVRTYALSIPQTFILLMVPIELSDSHCGLEPEETI